MKYDFELIMEEDNSLSKIIRQISKGSMVLEFGPATGRMTKFLKEHLKCNVYIVELDEEAAAVASQFAEDTIVGDIEDYAWLERWENVAFDYIVFADVLEHLRNPQVVLGKTKLLLKDTGKTIISVPNVGHNSIMLNLYQNIFNYTPVGLLDNTHIHLFAYNTLVQFCDFSGYVPVIEDAVYVNVGENEILSNYGQVSKIVQRELKKRDYNNVYQFVFTLQKKSFVKTHSVSCVKKLMPYTRDYRFEVFFDRGCGWMAEDSACQMYNPYKENHFVIQVEKGNTIKEVRIDPIDCDGGIEIKKILLYRKDREEISLETNNIISNAVLKSENRYLFYTEDPNILLKNVEWTGVEQIEVFFEYFELEKTVIDFLHLYAEKKESLENDLKLSLEELDRRADELKHRMDVINSKDREIAELKQQLDGKTGELECQMNVINAKDREIAELKQQLNRKTDELEHRIKLFGKFNKN